MGIINVLDISVANLIAAGEVVERPSSAVKELIENSVDAGAKNITVEIKNGGVSYLRVTDDGSGMSAEDAVISIKRHATSKIRTAKDLAQIMTLGFRGEALAAISAVSRFRILTKRREDKTGVSLSCEYGSSPRVEEAGCPDGTTIICEALFATTPARLKFLKSDISEAREVQSALERAALSHPEIAFRYICDGNMKISTSGNGKLCDTVLSVYGRDFASSLVPVSSESGGMGVEGYVCSPEYARGNRGMQTFFVNGRPVRSKLMTAALEQAFETYIPSGKFPSCVLNLKIHSAYVDVNIHPSKLEVKFSDERNIFSAVFYSVRGALENKISRPTLDIYSDKMKSEAEKAKITAAFEPIKERGEKRVEEIRIFDSVKASGAPTAATKRDFFPSAEKSDEPYVSVPKISSEVCAPASAPLSLRSEPGFEKAKMMTPASPENPDTDAKIPEKTAGEIPEYRIAGEVFDSYVILETADKMILVDKHAAHERINFEILRASMKDLTPHVQLFIVPENISLSSEEAEMCALYRDELIGVGFAFEIENNVAKLSGAPIGYDVGRGKELFSEMLGSLIDEGVPVEIKKRSVFEKALYQTSCKMSIKAGRHYDTEHLKWICDNLLRYDCIKFCPHGRPVAFEMSKRELDLRFGRIK